MGKRGKLHHCRCVRHWTWQIFMEAKRFSGSIIGIPEIACPIGSKFSALLCRCGHQQLRDARVRVTQRSKFGGWLTAGAGYVCIFLHHIWYILMSGTVAPPAGAPFRARNAFRSQPPLNMDSGHGAYLKSPRVGRGSGRQLGATPTKACPMPEFFLNMQRDRAMARAAPVLCTYSTPTVRQSDSPTVRQSDTPSRAHGRAPRTKRRIINRRVTPLWEEKAGRSASCVLYRRSTKGG
jgi:hypothetical protein